MSKKKKLLEMLNNHQNRLVKLFNILNEDQNRFGEVNLKFNKIIESSDF